MRSSSLASVLLMVLGPWLAPIGHSRPSPCRATQERHPVDRPDQQGVTDKTTVVRVRNVAGTYVPGLSVSWIELAELYEKAPDLILNGLDLDRARERCGREFVTDAEGVAHVPYSPAGGFIVAEADGLFGVAAYGHDTFPGETFELVLTRDLQLTARVLDANGASVPDVPVTLRLEQDGEVSDLVLTTTRADGTAVLRHLQFVLGSDRIEEEGFSVALGILANEHVAVALRPGPLPSAPLELRVPASGSLEIELVSASGERLLEPAVVQIVASSPGNPGDLPHDEWERPSQGTPGCRITSTGVVVLDRIGLGVELDVWVTPYWLSLLCRSNPRSCWRCGTRSHCRRSTSRCRTRL